MSEENLYQTFYKSNIIQPLKGFCATVEAGCSMNAAATNLGLTATAISKQVGSLEEKLKVKLFRQTPIRTNRIHLELTEDGEEFYKKAREAVDKIDGLLNEYLVEKKDKESKTLRISTTSAIISKFMPFVVAFKKDNPKIKVIFQSYSQEEALLLLSNNKLDVFISTLEDNEVVEKDMKFIKLTSYTPYWLLYKGHKLENKLPNEITKNDIIQDTLIFNKKGLTSTSLKNFVDTNKINSVMNLDEVGVEDLKSIIKTKAGIWVLFDIFLNKQDKNDFVFKQANNILSSGQCGFFVKNNFRNKCNIQKFIDFLISKKQEIFDLSFLNS